MVNVTGYKVFTRFGGALLGIVTRDEGALVYFRSVDGVDDYAIRGDLFFRR